MDWKLELVAIPVSDVDRAKAFYTEKAGFIADHDHRVSDEIRFVQLTPPGSACSIALGTGITDAPPGSVRGMQLVVPDIQAAWEQVRARTPEADRSKLAPPQIGKNDKWQINLYDPDGTRVELMEPYNVK